MKNTTCDSCGKTRACGMFIHGDSKVSRICGDCWESWVKQYHQYPSHKTESSNTNGGRHVIRSTKPLS